MARSSADEPYIRRKVQKYLTTDANERKPPHRSGNGHTGAQDPCSAGKECCVVLHPFFPLSIRTGSPLETVDVVPALIVCVATPFKSTALPLRNMYLNDCATIS
jgi:hypothetical protein